MRFVIALALIGAAGGAARLPAQQEQRYLYVALPGSDDAAPDRSVRILVFDITQAHQFVRRIPSGRPLAARRPKPRGWRRALGLTLVRQHNQAARVDRSEDRHHRLGAKHEVSGCDRIAVSRRTDDLCWPSAVRVARHSRGDRNWRADVTGWPPRRSTHATAPRVFAAWESPPGQRGQPRWSRPSVHSAPLCPFTVNARGTGIRQH
jgi:hypothetical protein